MKRLAILIAAAASLTLGSGAQAATTYGIFDVDAQTNSGTGPDFVQRRLSIGTYAITPVEGAYIAASYWRANRGCDGAGENCDQGFLWRLDVRGSAAADGIGFKTKPFVPGAAFATAQQALDAVAGDVYAFTLTQPQVISFGIRDRNAADNRGGVSFQLDKTSVVPLPATAPLAMAGFGLLAWLGRRRKAA